MVNTANVDRYMDPEPVVYVVHAGEDVIAVFASRTDALECARDIEARSANPDPDAEVYVDDFRLIGDPS